MRPIHIAFVALVLVAALIVAVMLNRPSPAPTRALQEAEPAMGPSKENVSPTVRQRMEELRHVVEKNPADATSMIELAHLLQDAHNTSEAVVFYARGLELDPHNHDVRIDYAVCLFGLGRREEALNQTKRVLKADPPNAKALYNAGAIFGNMGIADSARAYWNKLIALHPDDNLAAQAQSHLTQLGVTQR
jgi:tetratricopeptide (TPR) repeat protein